MIELVKVLNNEIAQMEIPEDRNEWYEESKFSVVDDGWFASVFWNSLLVYLPRLRSDDCDHETTKASIINALKLKADEIDRVIAALEKN